MRVLILNSDSPKNRGDRAILSGLIEVVRRRWPDAEIASLSQFDDRDAAWFGIRFLRMSPYSISPIDYLRLLRAARQADVVLWGGGEILKDYTNRLGLVYWALKLTGIRLVNSRIYGAYQGIGPTTAASSKKVIAYTVNRTRGFVVRDEQSAVKLRRWGVRVPVIASFDPAAIAPVAEWNEELAGRVHASLDVEADFFDNAIGLGLRRWFHYRKGALLPFALSGGAEETEDFVRYRDNMVELVDRLTSESDANVIFFPMHMAESEGDDAFAHDIISRMRHPERARVLDEDVFSPGELSAVIRRCRFFVASRLHSAILAACARIPALVLYYVDKGRLFYEQLGLQRLSRPIEATLEDGAVDEILGMIGRLEDEADAIVAIVETRVTEMAERLVTDAGRGWPVPA